MDIEVQIGATNRNIIFEIAPGDITPDKFEILAEGLISGEFGRKAESILLRSYLSNFVHYPSLDKRYMLQNSWQIQKIDLMGINVIK